MDGVHLDVLVGLVELDASGNAGIALGGSKPIADGLSILSAALDHIGDQHNLVVGMRVKMRRIGIVFSLECRHEILRHVAGVGRVELHDPDVSQGGLAGFLLKAEWQPYRADLNGIATAAFGDPGLRQRLCYFETLALKRVGRDYIYFAETRNSRGN